MAGAGVIEPWQTQKLDEPMKSDAPLQGAKDERPRCCVVCGTPYAGGNDDTVTGGSLNDTLVAIGSADTLNGGSGNDTLAVNEGLAAATLNLFGDAGDDYFNLCRSSETPP